MKVLFVCHANICRSFMAQQLMRQELPQAQVFSRGLYADSSLSVPEKIRLFLEKNGAEASVHTPLLLTKEDVKEADIVFFMEKQHLDMQADRWAEYSDKMWLLWDFAFGEEKDVPDPIGLSGRAFEKNALLLARAVHAAAQKLKNGQLVL